ncbi:MAG: nickel-responsive transcriptional regulator NikR [Bradyrhizobiaceae bacterium]|nr:MAG: nickel-responsive transcriptional regulator NikR [Bradyrhizobiaceae bacterium]
MNRVTITLDDDLLGEIDALVTEHGYQNRSEVIRDLARAGLAQKNDGIGDGKECVGALVYVYDHAARNLSHRLIETAHAHHDIAIATMHVHLDDASCLEITALKGNRSDIQHFADHAIAERGVRYGRVIVIPTQAEAGPTRIAHRHR